jgi:anti-anti-sigma factor
MVLRVSLSALTGPTIEDFQWPPLLIVLESAPDSTRMRCRGELDLATVDQLEREVRRVVASGCSVVALDLRDLSFFDCSGLRLLMRLKHDAATEGWTLSLRYGSGPVARLLELTRTQDQLAATG